jgi:hypothetical protein
MMSIEHSVILSYAHRLLPRDKSLSHFIHSGQLHQPSPAASPKAPFARFPLFPLFIAATSCLPMSLDISTA